MRNLGLFGQRHLGPNALAGFLFREAVARLEALELRLFVGGHHDDPIRALVGVGFDEQGGVVDDDGVRIVAFDFPAAAFLLEDHAGMDDGIQTVKLFRIPEDEPAQALPIHRSVGPTHVLPEGCDDLLVGGSSRNHGLTRQDIGVNEAGAAFHEESGDRAFSRGDPTCQSHNHGVTLPHCIVPTKVCTITAAMEAMMGTDLLDEAMKAQLAVEWDRLKKALSQAGDIGALNLEEWRIVVERDRRGLPPALSVAAIQEVLKHEKGGLRGQNIRGGEETADPTNRLAAQTQAGEVRLQDADHSELYAVLAFQAGKRLGMNDMQAAAFGDAVAYMLTGWMQAHATDARMPDKLIYEFKKAAGGAPEGGFLWSDLHSLLSRKGFKVMVEGARLVGTAMFR